MRQRVVVVDAFTDRPFGGNPAAVCVMERPADEAWMQSVAAEMNLAETAFLHPAGSAGSYRLRWFTPALEVDLCGHATLAAAHVLWEEEREPAAVPIQFLTKSGTLSAVRRADQIELDFPTLPTEACAPPDILIEALAREKEDISFVGRSQFDYLVELRNEQMVADLAPNLGRLKTLPVRGVIVTARADAAESSRGFDFVSRFFAPAAGVDEDPVTGSAHCALGLYWSRILGKIDFVARQLSRRGGVVRVSLRGDRTVLGGRAVTVMRGELVAPVRE